MLILNEAQVRKCLSMEKCISASRVALSALRRRRHLEDNAVNDGDDGFTSPAPSTSQSGIAVVPKRIILPSRPPVHLSASASASESASMSATKHATVTATATPSASDMTLFKPAAYYDNNHDNGHDNDNDNGSDSDNGAIMGMKIVSVRANNPSIGKPSTPATIAMLDVQTGEISSVLGATYLTAARTAAGSAIATQLCLGQGYGQGIGDHDDDHDGNGLHLVVFGAGMQAELHIRALKHVLKDKLTMVTIVNRTMERAVQLKHRLENDNDDDDDDDGDRIKNIKFHVMKLPPTATKGNENSSVSAGASTDTEEATPYTTRNLQETIQSANIIVTATNTLTPLFDWNWVSDGCHINAVGSYQPKTEEVDCTFVRDRCMVVVDTMEALNVGDLKYVHHDSDMFVGLVGDFLLSSKDGDMDGALEAKKEKKKKCTLYKSVGTAIQDVVTAQSVVETANKLGLGTRIDM